MNRSRHGFVEEYSAILEQLKRGTRWSPAAAPVIAFSVGLAQYAGGRPMRWMRERQRGSAWRKLYAGSV
jgi:hypothetical protein